MKLFLIRKSHTIIVFIYYFLIMCCVTGCAPQIKEVNVPKHFILTDNPLMQFDEKGSLTFKLFPNTYYWGFYGEDIGQVTLGIPQISFLSSKNKLAYKLDIEPDRMKWDIFLIYIPFTLHPLHNNFSYTKIGLHVNLENQDAFALDLLPKNISSKQTIHKKFVLSPEFKFKDFAGKIGELCYEFDYQSLEPIISAFGLGENRFYWEFSSSGIEPVFPGTKHVFVVLQVPLGTEFIGGTIHFEILGNRKSLGGIFQPTVSSTKNYILNWNLAEVKLNSTKTQKTKN
jgi:hypothetical protein